MPETIPACRTNNKHRRTHRWNRGRTFASQDVAEVDQYHVPNHLKSFHAVPWRGGMHQEAFKRHVSIACWLWPLSNLGRNLDFKVLFALQDYVPFHCAHDLLMATCKQRTLCESPSAKSLTECHTHGIHGVSLLWHWLNRTSKLSEVMVRISSCRFPVQKHPLAVLVGLLP